MHNAEDRQHHQPMILPQSAELAVLSVVYRLHFARACLTTLYAAIVEKRSHDRPSSASHNRTAPSASSSSALSAAAELDEERLREATALQLKNALLMKSLEEQGADFTIDFANDLKPHIRGKLGIGGLGSVLTLCIRASSQADAWLNHQQHGLFEHSNQGGDNKCD